MLHTFNFIVYDYTIHEQPLKNKVFRNSNLIITYYCGSFLFFLKLFFFVLTNVTEIIPYEYLYYF